MAYPPPGWYDDPAGNTALERYWDGNQWTEHTRETAAAAQHQEDLGLPAVLLVPGNLRWLLSRFLRRAVPQLKVIANVEVPDSKIIKVTTLIGASK